MRLELKSVLGQSLDTDGSFFQLFRAAHHLEDIAAKWAPGILGELLAQTLSNNLVCCSRSSSTRNRLGSSVELASAFRGIK